MAKEESYRITVICTNCGHSIKEIATDGAVVGLKWILIPKVLPAKEFLDEMPCPTCGCKGHLVRQ